MVARKSRILVTGATGFIGDWIANKLIEKGYDLTFLVRKESTPMIEQLFPSNGNLDGLVVNGDLSEPGLANSLKEIRRAGLDISEIWHIAAKTAFEGPGIYETNVHGTRNLLDFAAASGVSRFIYFSTAFVSGDGGGLVMEADPTPLDSFRNTYEKSKREGERLVREHSEKYGLEFIIFRPSVVVGDSARGMTKSYRGFYHGAHAIYLAVMRERKKAGLNPPQSIELDGELPGRETCTFNLVPVDYVAGAAVDISQKPGASNLVYHLVNPHPPTQGDILRVLTNEFRFSGLQYSGSSDLPAEPTDVTRLLFRSLRQYTPYMMGEPVFDDTNTRRMSSPYSRRVIDALSNEELIRRVTEYAVRTNWGKAQTVPQ